MNSIFSSGSSSSKDSYSLPSSPPPPPPTPELTELIGFNSLPQADPNLNFDTHTFHPSPGAGSTLIDTRIQRNPKRKILKRNTYIAHWLLTACTFAMVIVSIWAPTHKNDIVYPDTQQPSPSYKSHAKLIAHILIKLAKLPFSPIADSALDDNTLVRKQLEFILNQLTTAVTPSPPPPPPPLNETQ